jgi:hypothetical protein
MRQCARHRVALCDCDHIPGIRTFATMKRGAIYEYQYLDHQSRLLSSFDIRNTDCDTDGSIASAIGAAQTAVR